MYHETSGTIALNAASPVLIVLGNAYESLDIWFDGRIHHDVTVLRDHNPITRQFLGLDAELAFSTLRVNIFGIDAKRSGAHFESRTLSPAGSIEASPNVLHFHSA